MSNATKAASFEDFLNAPVRLAQQGSARTSDSTTSVMPSRAGKPLSVRSPKRPTTSSQKVKVGLTIGEDIIDAIDDYIYHERKQGRRLKKNDVYEAALRQFLGLEGGNA